MDYSFKEDLLAIREILSLTQEELAKKLNVEKITISRNENGITKPSNSLLEKTYEFAYENNIKINVLKEMFHKERLKKNNILLFHGSKSNIEGDIRVDFGRNNNDFGQGFYTGETYEQAISFVSGYNEASVYYLEFNPSGLKKKEYSVDQRWMLTIAYNRETLNDYINNEYIQELIKESKDCDYIVAPIADNRMFNIIDSFINGEITDEQCKHCLAATNLGKQYVFISDKATKNLRILEKCYLCNKEKEYYKTKKAENHKLGNDKVKLARIKYRGIGKYIDEILGDYNG